MLESLSFTFNGISCEDMGLVMINDGGGLYEENFLPSRRIIETTIANKNTPNYGKVELTPLSFSISFFIEEWESRDNLRAIARWLFTDYYKPLWFSSNPSRILYAMVDGDPKLFHNGLKQGYVTVNFRCNSPFSFSEPNTEVFNVNGSFDFNLFNEGDLTIRPNMKITCLSVGDISIKNHQNNQEFKITNVQPNEIITVDCNNETIVSSLEYINRFLYDSHNDVWLDIEGNNTCRITFKGNFKIEFTYEYVYLYE